MNKWLALLLFVAVTLAAASMGRLFPAGDWYATLAKPDWTPPGQLFGPVWAVLYIFIALAGWLVWRAGGLSIALGVWCAQLVFNGAWSGLMFGAHEIGWALADIVALWSAIGLFIVTAWPVSRTAALLFLPYWAWVTFATALNFALWRLNG